MELLKINVGGVFANASTPFFADYVLQILI